MNTEYRIWSKTLMGNIVHGSWLLMTEAYAQSCAAESRKSNGILASGVESRVKEGSIEFWGESVYTFSEWLALPDDQIAAIFQRCLNPQEIKQHLQPLLNSTEHAFAQQPTEENLERLRKAFKNNPTTD